MASPIRKFRLRLPCKDHADYAGKFAKRFEGEFFVPSDVALADSAAAEVHLVFADGVVGVHGKAVVVRTTEERGAKGLVLRFTDQHTRSTGPFVAQDDAERISDFDDEAPTRQSQLSEVLASAIKDEPEEPEIIIENRPPASAPMAAPKTALTATEAANAESDFGDLMSEIENGGASASPATEQQASPAVLTPAPATPKVPTPATTRSEAPTAPPPMSTSASPVSKGAIPASAEDLLAKPASSVKLWIVGGLLIAAGAVVFIVTQSGDSPPKATPEVVEPTGPTPAEVAAKQRDEQIRRTIATADARAASGRLTGPDSALEQLLAAKEMAPKNTEVEARLGQLADKFEELASSAEEAGNLAEAATHLQAALLADATREELAARMSEIEEKVRADAP